MPASSSLSVRGWAWAPVLLLLVAILVLKAINATASLDLPVVRAVLTLVFGTVVAMVVLVLVGRSFLVRGHPGMLLLGCGLLFVGASGIVATLVGGKDINLNVTIFNLCGWFAGVCHLFGAFLLLRPRRPLPAPGLWLWVATLVVLSAIGLVALAAREGWTPVFFLQGQGGTPVRQLVLSSSITFFGLAALLPGAANRHSRSPFFQWYSLALSSTAIGLFGVMLQPSFGSLLSWTAWTAMCLAGAYMFVAALASLHEARAWGTTLEAALHESEERFQTLTQASFEGIALTEEGRLIDGNDQFFQMLGYRREELLGRELPALHTAEYRERVLEVIRAGREACLESAMVRKDGSHILIEAHGKPLLYQGRGIRVIAFRDITARKQAEEALREAQAKLQAHAAELERTVAQRTAKLQEAVAELEHFSYAITHDMRAPLRAMQGYAEILGRHCAECPQESNREFFRRITIAAGRMDQLITDSLNYSKAVRQKFTLEPVNLRELLQGMIETYPHLLPDQADIALAPDLPTVMGSPAALTQCFGNLLSNAVKFAKPNTKPHIRVWAKPVPRSAAPSGATAPAPPTKVRIWVEDNGIGISREMQERIFGLFERVSNEQEGTGLGLAIVRKLVRRLGGEVGVESEPGQGSRFWVDLELAPAVVPLSPGG
jgi:PAS domain S-box-containing protein